MISFRMSGPYPEGGGGGGGGGGAAASLASEVLPKILIINKVN